MYVLKILPRPSKTRFFVMLVALQSCRNRKRPNFGIHIRMSKALEPLISKKLYIDFWGILAKIGVDSEHFSYIMCEFGSSFGANLDKIKFSG